MIFALVLAPLMVLLDWTLTLFPEPMLIVPETVIVYGVVDVAYCWNCARVVAVTFAPPVPPVAFRP